jgi:hypothetical protein
MCEEDTEGVLLPVPPVAEDVQCTRKDENALAMPRGMQTAAQKAEEDEDQVMALWLSNPDEDVADDEDWAMMNEVGIQIGNAPVKGEESSQ